MSTRKRDLRNANFEPQIFSITLRHYLMKHVATFRSLSIRYKNDDIPNTDELTR
jgi:hypothetical protein